MFELNNQDLSALSDEELEKISKAAHEFRGGLGSMLDALQLGIAADQELSRRSVRRLLETKTTGEPK